MMSEVKHTTGPWRTQGWVPTWAYIPVHDARYNLVCSLYPDTGHNYTRDEVEANARLIAAAPELLEHVNLFARSLEYEIRKSESSGDDEGARLKSFTLALVRETIAKAEGRS